MKKKIKLAVKIIFILSAIIIIFNKIDINELKKISLKHPVYLFFAFVFYNISQFVSALRVHTYLQKINITPKFKEQLILYYLGMFYNTLLPGGIGGDAYKAYTFEKTFKTGYRKIIKALLIDRVSGLFAILAIIGVLAAFSEERGVFVYLLALIFFAPVGIYIFHRYFFKEFLEVSWKNFTYSVVIQTLQGAAFYMILLSLGVTSHINDFLILFFISSVISVIPVSVGGVGLRELTFLWGLEYLHLNPALGVVSAFLFFVITVISSAAGMFFIKFKLGE